MKLLAALVVATLPLLASCSPAEHLAAEVREPLPRSGHQAPASEDYGVDEANRTIISDYEYEVDGAEVDADAQTEEPSPSPSPVDLRKADDEAAKERRRLANLRRRFTLPFYQRHQNETSDELADGEAEAEEDDISDVADDAETEVDEGVEEGTTGDDGEKPTPHRPRHPGRFGGHQSDEPDSQLANDKEDGEIQDPDTNNGSYRRKSIGRFGGHRADELEAQSAPDENDSEIRDPATNDRPYRRRGIGRFGGRPQVDELESESTADTEGGEIQDGFGSNVDEGRNRPGQLGRFGRRRQPDESNSESVPESQSEVLDQNDQFTRSSTSAPIRGLAGLLNGSYRSSRLKNKQAEDAEEPDGFNGGSSGGEEYDTDNSDDQDTSQQFAWNAPRHGGLRSRYQEEEPVNVDDVPEETARETFDQESTSSVDNSSGHRPLRSRYQNAFEDGGEVLEDDELYVQPSR